MRNKAESSGKGTFPGIILAVAGGALLPIGTAFAVGGLRDLAASGLAVLAVTTVLAVSAVTLILSRLRPGADPAPTTRTPDRAPRESPAIHESIPEQGTPFRQLVELMSEGLLVADPGERITFANRRFGEIVGVKAESLIGLEMYCLLDGTNKEHLLKQSERRSRGKSSRYELEWKRQDGETVTTLVSAVPLYSGDGRYTGSFAVVTDLTERQRLEEQMSRAERLRALGELAGGIAHDFNNRLAAILGNAQLLLMDAEDPGVIESLRTIERSSLEGANVVRRILDFTRAHPEKAPEEVEIQDLLDEAIDLLRFRWDASDAEYRVIRDFRATRVVSGFAGELIEAFVAIFSNAFDAMPNGGELRVTAFDRDQGVGIRISDTGEGMDRDSLRRAFDPFFTTRGPDRPGLGLSTAFGIVQRHSGALRIRSEPGRGTTVNFRLPARVRRPPRAEKLPAPARPRLLVVDDDPDIREFIRSALSRGGFDVVAVADPDEALDQLGGDRKFDLLLTDLDMPKMRGTRLAEKAHEIDANTRVGLITGWGAEGEREARACPAVDLLIQKPFTLHSLIDQVRSVLDQPTPLPSS